MADRAEEDRLKALDARIAAAKAAVEGPRKTGEDGHRNAQLAWRMVIELVAGLLIGFGIGYGLDSLFGTMPIFLVLFILAGFAAGVKTMLRSAQDMQTRDAQHMGVGQETKPAAKALDDEEDD
jgi:ATP synthase protein I